MGIERGKRLPERNLDRISLIQAGPQFVPEELKEAEYRYEWAGYIDEKSQFSMVQLLRMGYEPVKKGAYELGAELLARHGISIASQATDGDNIIQIGKDGIKSYLMRISLEKYAEIEEHRNKIVDDREKGMSAKLRQAGGNEELNRVERPYNTNHMFTGEVY